MFYMPIGHKISLYIRMIYGVIVAFIVVGFLLGKTQAVFFAVIVTVCYTLMRILEEAMIAWRLLRHFGAENKLTDE